MLHRPLMGGTMMCDTHTMHSLRLLQQVESGSTYERRVRHSGADEHGNPQFVYLDPHVATAGQQA